MAIFIRILLRYGAGFLVAKGLMAPEAGMTLSSDPDVQMAVQIVGGAAVGAVSEAWMWLAKRWGWAT